MRWSPVSPLRRSTRASRTRLGAVRRVRRNLVKDPNLPRHRQVGTLTTVYMRFVGQRPDDGQNGILTRPSASPTRLPHHNSRHKREDNRPEQLTAETPA